MSSTSTPSSVPAGMRVLVVDDHPDTVMFLARLLQKAGCDVTTATGMRDAEARLNEREFDLLISDLGLPDGSGMELMRRARQRRHAIKGIAISGQDAPDQRKLCEGAGFSECLVKPVDMPRLIQAMRRTLGV